MSEDTILRIERVMDAPPKPYSGRGRPGSPWSSGTVRVTASWRGSPSSMSDVGGSYRVEFGPAGAPPYVEHGEYLAVDRPHRLVMTETLDGVDSPWAHTTVTVELREENGKTHLTLVHTGFPSGAHRDIAAGGWPGFLDRIEALLTQ